MASVIKSPSTASAFLRQVMTVRQGGGQMFKRDLALRDPPDPAASHVVPRRAEPAGFECRRDDAT
jgi:hypothetical protein